MVVALMCVADEIAAESATLAAAERHMEGPMTCKECAHYFRFGFEDVCCVDRDTEGSGFLYVIDYPDEDQSQDGGCDLWEPSTTRRGGIKPLMSDETRRAASALGLGA